MPIWSILVATLPSRQEKLKRLLDVLLPQAERAGNVEVVGLHNYGDQLIGDYRQALLDDARGEYVSFVDDDDLVDPYFVQLVERAMRSRPDYTTGVPAFQAMKQPPDYIAFRHAYYEDGNRWPRPVITGLEHGGWFDTSDGHYRDVTHINPVRAEIAHQASFIVPAGTSEDRHYDATVRKLAHSQVTLQQVLYHYYHSTRDSVQVALPPQLRVPPLGVDSGVFRWHEWSYRDL